MKTNEIRRESPAAPSGLDAEARHALAAMEDAARRFLGLELLPDGSVRVTGEERTRATVDMAAPFGPIAHRIQWIREDAHRLVEFHAAWARALEMLGRRAESFAGQVEAFGHALDLVPPPPPPRLRLVA